MKRFRGPNHKREKGAEAAVMNGATGTMPGNSEKKLAMLSQQLCGVHACKAVRVTTFAAEDLCCDHFVERCYEILERIVPSREMKLEEQEAAEEPKQVTEECSRKVLEIALGTEELSNLQRARLLDILLWAGEISTTNKAKKNQNSSLVRFPNDAGVASVSGTEKKKGPRQATLRSSTLY